MLTESIRFHIDSFEKEFTEWQERFRKDSKERLFVNYTFISEKIKGRVKISLNPAIEGLNEIKSEYAEKYRHKDLKYHTDIALTNCDAIKVMLKEVYDAYYNQENYDSIKLRWERCFPVLFKRIGNVRERLYMLDRILVNEASEKNL